MDNINPFTNAPKQPANPAQAAGQPVKPELPAPKKDLNIKPVLKAAVMIIIGAVIAKFAFDSVAPMLKQQQKPDINTAKTISKPAAPKTAAAPKPKPAKGKKAETLSLSETSEAAKKNVKPQQQTSSDQFILNGIFLSEADGMSSAIVNNRIVQIGDTVDGAIVRSITMDGIELSRNDAVIKLRNK